MKRLFSALMGMVLGSSLLLAQTDVSRQKIYSLKNGESIKIYESTMGVSNSPEGYMLLVEKAPKGADILPEYYIVLPKKTLGPFGNMIPHYMSEDGMLMAVTASKYTKTYDDSPNPTMQVIFNDGTVMGPYEGFTNVSFSGDNTEWAIMSDNYDAEKAVSTTTLQFKGGKPIKSNASEYVQYAPKGHNSVRIKSYSLPSGEYKTEYTFSNGKTTGPVESYYFQFREDGNGFDLVARKNDKVYVINENGETEVPAEAHTLVSNPTNGKDWAVMVSGDDDSGFIQYANGKKTDRFPYLMRGSLFYDKGQNAFGWIWVENQQNVYLQFSNGKKEGPIALKPIPQPTVSDGGDQEGDNTFYASASTTFNDKQDKYVVSVYASTGYAHLYHDGGKFKNLNSEYSISFVGFDGQDKLYYIEEREVQVPDQEYPDYEYNIVFVESGKKFKTNGYPADLKFTKGGAWYMIDGEGNLVLSDGAKYPNAFALRYDKTESKLYWLSFEGKEVFFNNRILK